MLPFPDPFIMSASTMRLQQVAGANHQFAAHRVGRRLAASTAGGLNHDRAPPQRVGNAIVQRVSSTAAITTASASVRT